MADITVSMALLLDARRDHLLIKWATSTTPGFASSASCQQYAFKELSQQKAPLLSLTVKTKHGTKSRRKRIRCRQRDHIQMLSFAPYSESRTASKSNVDFDSNGKTST
eukprot:6487966-Amphidinium_carterae.3